MGTQINRRTVAFGISAGVAVAGVADHAVMDGVERDWLLAAYRHLDNIARNRALGWPGNSAFCIFEIGIAYVQFLAPHDTNTLVAEAVSAKSEPQLRQLLTPESERQLAAFGFDLPGPSPNYTRTVDICCPADLEQAAGLAFQVLRGVYGVRSFNLGRFTVAIPKHAIAVQPS